MFLDRTVIENLFIFPHILTLPSAIFTEKYLWNNCNLGLTNGPSIRTKYNSKLIYIYEIYTFALDIARTCQAIKVCKKSVARAKMMYNLIPINAGVSNPVKYIVLVESTSICNDFNHINIRIRCLTAQSIIWWWNKSRFPGNASMYTAVCFGVLSRCVEITEKDTSVRLTSRGCHQNISSMAKNERKTYVSYLSVYELW